MAGPRSPHGVRGDACARGAEDSSDDEGQGEDAASGLWGDGQAASNDPNLATSSSILDFVALNRKHKRRGLDFVDSSPWVGGLCSDKSLACTVILLMLTFSVQVTSSTLGKRRLLCAVLVDQTQGIAGSDCKRRCRFGKSGP